MKKAASNKVQSIFGTDFSEGFNYFKRHRFVVQHLETLMLICALMKNVNYLWISSAFFWRFDRISTSGLQNSSSSIPWTKRHKCIGSSNISPLVKLSTRRIRCWNRYILCNANSLHTLTNFHFLYEISSWITSKNSYYCAYFELYMRLFWLNVRMRKWISTCAPHCIALERIE